MGRLSAYPSALFVFVFLVLFFTPSPNQKCLVIAIHRRFLVFSECSSVFLSSLCPPPPTACRHPTASRYPLPSPSPSAAAAAGEVHPRRGDVRGRPRCRLPAVLPPQLQDRRVEAQDEVYPLPGAEVCTPPPTIQLSNAVVSMIVRTIQFEACIIGLRDRCSHCSVRSLFCWRREESRPSTPGRRIVRAPPFHPRRWLGNCDYGFPAKTTSIATGTGVVVAAATAAAAGKSSATNGTVPATAASLRPAPKGRGGAETSARGEAEKTVEEEGMMLAGVFEEAARHLEAAEAAVGEAPWQG